MDLYSSGDKMNEKIKDLAEKAELQFYNLSTGEGDNPQVCGTPEQLEKFAELIVRECAQAFEAEVDTWKEMDPYQGSIKRQGTKAIKQHFGVE